MEILMTPEHYVIVDGEETLWCSRLDGKLEPRKRSELHQLADAVCLGTVYGVIGKFQPHPDSDQRLVLIRQTSLIGSLPGNHQVFKVNKVVLLPLSVHESPELEMEPCTKHPSSWRRPERSPASELQQRALQKTWQTIKTATAQVKPRKTVQSRERDKYERRLLDELLKMFNDTDSFYFSPTGDLTNTLQRQVERPPPPTGSPSWERLDERFFWNREMLRELTEMEGGDHWVLPVIQGFVQVERCQLEPMDPGEAALSQDSSGAWFDVAAKEFTMALVSRRSRYRAGTRYKRRGVDEMGKCANYVETEQIFEHASHVVSFVQVRGSVPVFWSQPGYKYRPPPRLDRDEEETKQAFAKHFAEQIELYGSQVIVSLVEQTGKEKLLADAYLNHVLHLDSPELTYVSFDFHEYCRGMRFENVSVLIDGIKDLVRDMRYCWLDQQGLICGQRGVFRVNCIDCLDRTNIVQTAIAKTAMDTQFVRLGLLPPEGVLPTACRRIFQMLWANNGDIISRQYAGTAALKGDFTRTGSRRLAGMMKDGYNSANRYYVNRFKDAYRQATIDLMLGNPVTEDFMAVSPEQDDEPVLEMQDQEHQEHVKQLIEHCKKMLIPESEVVLGGWALIDADPVTGDPGQGDMDSILVLTKDSYYVAEYDDQTDRITKYQRVFLEDLEKMELGPEPSLFKSRHYCLRFHYLVNGQSGYFHMFRSTGTRFFNNVAVPISGEEETIESLKAICESFKVALSVKSLSVPLFEGKLERRRSKLPFVQGERPGSLGLAPLGAMTRNVSEGQLMAFVSVGSRALSNVTSQFARLNPMRSVRGLAKRPPAALGALTEGSFQVDSSSDSEEDSARWLRQPLASERTLNSDYSSDSDAAAEPGHDALLESCGILATSPSLGASCCEPRPAPTHQALDIDDFVLDAMRRASLRQPPKAGPPPLAAPPEIQAARKPAPQVSGESPAEAPSSGGRLRQLSKSSEELESRPTSPGSRLFVLEEGPPREPAKMKMSHSESAIQDFSLPGPSPVSSPIVIKKDLVLSPLSRIAKGVQTLGLNLRPAAMVGRRAPGPVESEALRQRKQACRSHILQL